MAAFTGSLVGVAARQTILSFALFRVEENHEGFGFFDASIAIR